MADCTLPDGGSGVLSDFGCIPNNPVGFIGKFYSIGLGFIGGVAILAILYGAYIIMTSSGDPQRLRNGKSYIFYAISGLLLTIFGYIFVQVVIRDILKVPGF